MSQIKIGPFSFIVLKQDGNRVLLAWTERDGVQKERWIILRNCKIDLKSVCG